MHVRPSMSTRSLPRAAVVLLITALAVAGVGLRPAAADEGVPWTVHTASNSFGADRQNYRYSVNPGGEVNDAVVVANHGSAPLHLAVYGADGFTTKSGKLDLRTQDAKSTGVGAWVHPSRPTVTIAPGRSVEVPFAVAVPDNATPGDHMGGVITSLTQADEAGTNVERRLAIRIRLRIGGELTPKLAVEAMHIDYSDHANPFAKGDATLTYTIHNTGDAILAARQVASVSGPSGRFNVAAEPIDDSPELLPGERWKVSVPVRDVTPALRLAATVTLTPLITDASGSIASLDSTENTTHGWAVPWVLFILLCLVAGLAVVAIRYGRQIRKAGATTSATREPTIREPETAQR